jgi:hypothetical protein
MPVCKETPRATSVCVIWAEVVAWRGWEEWEMLSLFLEMLRLNTV